MAVVRKARAARREDDPQTAPCKLCLKVKPLLKSHVISEFLYSPTYARKGGALSFNANRGHVGILRKGIRERLLCGACERVVKEYEDYFATRWVQASRVPDPLPAATEIRVDGLDYRCFKLFHLSVVWRIGVAAGEDFAPIDLGVHQEPLRQMILDGSPGPSADYPVFGYVMRMRNQPRPVKGGLAWASPERRKDIQITSAIYAGCGWHCALALDADTEFKDLYLTEAGSITLPIESIASRQSLIDLLKGRGASFHSAVKKLT
jgi:hypothetical protein